MKLVRTLNLYAQYIETPLGTMIACTSEQGICLLEYADKKRATNVLSYMAEQFNAVVLQENHLFLEKLSLQLSDYFSGTLKKFSLPLDIRGTDFQCKAWEVLQQIPYGETRSYKEQSIALGNPKSMRAVGNANGANYVSIIIPCHRVIGSSGQLTGYGGGLWRKKYLLDLEHKNK